MATREVSWWDYATAYDLLCDHNPHYQQNLNDFKVWLSSTNLDDGIRICEVGAGTGNFLRAAGSVYPNAEFYHWDWNSTMNAIALDKYNETKIAVEIHNSDISDFPGDLPQQDVMLALNSLYTFPDPVAILEKAYALLKPGGWLYTIDIGRPLKVGAWAGDLLRHNLRTIGVRQTAYRLYRMRHAILANQSIDNKLSNGSYWQHKTDEFGRLLESLGFKVTKLESCYRDCADRAICRKPIS